MRRILQRGFLVVGAVALLACSVAPAEAQRRAIRRPFGRSVVVVGGYYRPAFYNPFFWGGYSGFWSGYAGWGWHPFYYGGYYPPQWGYYGRRDQAAVRIQVKPREAQVYVDGYYAGIVDDFDGALQRLRARAGDHEIVLYLKGYRTERQTLRLEPGEEYTIRLEMEPLAPGETNEAPPVPAPRGAQEPRDPRDLQGPPPVQAPRPGSGGLEPPPAPPRAGEWPGRSRPTAEGFGTLSIRVQPSGAEVLIDGEPWQGPEGQERLTVQLSEGLHRVEVRKDGFVTFTTEIEVRQGETAPLNVSLPRR